MEAKEGERYVVIEQVTNPGERSPWYKIRLENGLAARVAEEVAAIELVGAILREGDAAAP